MKIDKIQPSEKNRLSFHEENPHWDNKIIKQASLITPDSIQQIDGTSPDPQHIDNALIVEPSASLIIVGTSTHHRDSSIIEHCSKNDRGCEWLSVLHACDLYIFLLHDKRRFILLLYP